MTPEQKQRIEQIERDHKNRVKYNQDDTDTHWDIDFLLSLAKGQEAEITKLTTQWCQCGHSKDQHGFFSDHDECYECDQASPDLCCEWRPAPRPNENENAAIVVSAERVLLHHRSTDIDYACFECCRDRDDSTIVDGFICVYHRAKAAIQEREAKQS